MINYDTILSSYDDKLTLMQWLKKVEAALKDASAVSFKVNKTGDATLTFSIVFNDGSEIVSDPMTLQQGESVASAYIQNGNLHLILTNGDDLDAGNMFNGDVTLTGSITAASVKTSSLTSDAEEIAAQKPIVEVMNGYLFEPATEAQENGVTFTYAGVCKNANKLTFVICGVFKHDTGVTISANFTIGRFYIPAVEVANKIIPMLSNVVDVKKLGYFADYQTIVDKNIQIFKQGTQRLAFQCIGMTSGFSLDVQYCFRIEETILLSDNLAA